MKTRVIALVLAVCMMLGLCAFASASDDVHVHSVDGDCPCYCTTCPPSLVLDYMNGKQIVRCINCGWWTEV